MIKDKLRFNAAVAKFKAAECEMVQARYQMGIERVRYCAEYWGIGPGAEIIREHDGARFRVSRIEWQAWPEIKNKPNVFGYRLTRAGHWAVRESFVSQPYTVAERCQ